MKRPLDVKGHYKKGERPKEGELFQERKWDARTEWLRGNSTDSMTGEGKRRAKRCIQRQRRKKWRPKCMGGW